MIEGCADTQEPDDSRNLVVSVLSMRESEAPFCNWWLPLGYLVFFLSGAAALVYEISWSRQIGLMFGHTVHAAAVTLASYFAGLGFGSFVGARWGARIAPLLGYGVAELVVAFWTLVIPAVVEWSESPDVAAWLNSSSLAAQMSARVAFCFLLLLPATTALGATLPLMAEFLTRRTNKSMADPKTAATVSLSYALNTAGALVGVLSATFFLLLVVGVRTSSYVAAGISVVCALAAFLLHGRERKVANWLATPRDSLSPPTKPQRLWFFVAALSGFGILALEVLYTRMFSLVFHNSTYTFGAVVAVFLASLALGAAFASRLQKRYETVRLIGWAAGCGGVATAISVVVFVTLTELDYYSYGDSFLQYIAGAFALVVLVVVPPVTLLGTLLPLTWKAAGSREVVGCIVGRLTAVNTFAAANGALAASFLFLPWLGLWESVALLSVVFFSVGCALLNRNGHSRSACGAIVIFGTVLLFVFGGPMKPNSGHIGAGEQLVRRWNSPYGWIDLVSMKETGAYKVRQNLHYRFGQTGGNGREFRQAHIPLLLHEHPHDVLFLGLGTGLTVGGAVPHREVKNIVAVELIAEVVEAARLLADFNYGVVDHPKSIVRVDDARHYLLSTSKRFDVIVSDLFVPWESESGYLYTVEHYRVARRQIKPGGLFCQWLPLYQVGQREFELIANSFASVFPFTTIWWGEMDQAKPIVALMGSNSPLEINGNTLGIRIAELERTSTSTNQDLRSVEQFYSYYLGDWSLRGPSLLNTDEHPRVEFLTPISNRDHRMLTGLALKVYYNEVLSQLPSGAASLSVAKSSSATDQQRRAWQRLILFGESPP